MPATLDGFLRSTAPAKRGTKSVDGADSGSAKKKAKKAGSPSDGAGGTPKTSGKGKAKAASPASAKGKKGKAVKGKKGKAVKGKKRKKTFVEDNRNLGTVDLLDSTDDDEVEVVAESPSAAKSGSNSVKRIVLEEEEWLADEADQPKKQDFATDAPVEQDDGPEGTANLLSAQSKLRDPAEQDPFDGCTDDEGELTVLGPSKKGKERADAAEEDDLVVEGGLTCPGCEALLDSMPEGDRDSHVNSCLDASVAQTSTSSAPSRGLLAPLSRLFTFSSSSSAPSASSSKPAPAPQPGPSKPMSFLPNAFTALMRGHDEANQWKKAEEADKQKGRLPKGEERKVPFYKWIDGMEITVDAFKYGKIDGCKAYFLSHAHSDHYQNLNSSWSHGEIYASQTTINLIKLKLKLKDEYLFPLPMDKTVKVHGIDVTLIDANHCPGSVLFLFEGPHTDPKSPFSKTPNRIFRYLHCGDFRASPQHILHPSMSYPTPATSRMMARASSSTSQPSSSQPPDPLPGRTLKRLDAIYLDTTYLSPSYCFPAQELVISACAELVRERILGEGEERESQTPMPGLADDEQLYGDVDEPMELERLPEETDDAVMEGGGDEEAWLAVHADETQDAEEQEGETQVGATEAGDDSRGWSLANVDDPACCDDGDDLGEFSAPQVQHSAGGPVDVKAKGEVTEEQSEEKPAVDGAADIKAEEADEKPDVKPKKERLLVLVGTYSIGKERIVKAIAQALSTKVFCDSYKRSLFLAQDDPDLHALLTEDPLEAQVHIGGLRDITREAMQEYLAKFKAPRIEGGFTKMIGLRPTGWTYRSETKDKYPSIPKILQIEQQRKFSPAGLYPQRDSTPITMAFGVPYSEHSSFFELTCFCLSLDWTRVIPTVNVHTASSRNKMKGWIDRWGAEKKRRADAKLPKIVPFRNVHYW
ncbi:putative DNA repair protein Pso2/Snm1 [Rhodotorula toruloides ATCC 204091]|uniref:BY PROTMAP: gi/342320970/gb/EGU12908.1/ putative DNA repair protein Pso2/Snm1 [Rhodotorula glutinis ATCC 204091] n=1 Tax=Rhodotorula toruloides TaxID=5286 RepID=A0A0K3CDI4_RHOTO|nr:putative DNA repair protein Pso2/Snm1 [Rhodotorula toruloides ATCC 204091]